MGRLMIRNPLLEPLRAILGGAAPVAGTDSFEIDFVGFCVRRASGRAAFVWRELRVKADDHLAERRQFDPAKAAVARVALLAVGDLDPHVCDGRIVDDAKILPVRDRVAQLARGLLEPLGLFVRC